jgi:hypothetical protein
MPLIKKFLLPIIFIFLALFISNLIELMATHYYLGKIQKERVEMRLKEQPDITFEIAVNEVSSSITKEDVKVGYAYGLLLAWIPWFILGGILPKSRALYLLVCFAALLSFDPLWLCPIIFLTAFYFGTKAKKRWGNSAAE